VVHLVWETVRGTAGTPHQEASLFGPYSAAIGPRGGGRAWWWAVYHVRTTDGPVAEGFAYDERDAKAAVEQWARPRAPRSLRRRLRSLVHRV
jgi:hypothetical protein